MHMANELLSLPVATGTLTLAGAGLGLVCKKLRDAVTPDQLGLMGILGAFVFAGQMINLPLPGLPGTSGHLVGTVLLAVILGPHAAALVMSSIVIVQCLIFQDGGLLALGCNLINMALVPAYLGYFLYRILARPTSTPRHAIVAAALAAGITIEAGAALVPVEAGLSGVLTIPWKTFLWTMLGVHLVIGVMEALLTVAVLSYLQKLRPDMVMRAESTPSRGGKKTVLLALAGLTVFTGAVLSLFASQRPDGLEWSYARRPDQPAFTSVVAAREKTRAADEFQSRYALLPDYTKRTAPLGQAGADETLAHRGWTSLAGVFGAMVTMVLIWAGTRTLRKKEAAT